MARRRHAQEIEPTPAADGEQLLTWSRYRHVPVSLLGHYDPDVRHLAEATEAAVLSLRLLLFSNGTDEARSRARIQLAAERRRFAEPRGLPWAEPR